MFAKNKASCTSWTASSRPLRSLAGASLSLFSRGHFRVSKKKNSNTKNTNKYKNKTKKKRKEKNSVKSRPLSRPRLWVETSLIINDLQSVAMVPASKMWELHGANWKTFLFPSPPIPLLNGSYLHCVELLLKYCPGWFLLAQLMYSSYQLFNELAITDSSLTTTSWSRWSFSWFPK